MIRNPATNCYTTLDSPVGRLLIAGDQRRVTDLRFLSADSTWQYPADWREDVAPLRHCIEQLEEYFSGRLQAFKLDVEPAGTRFQRQVWSALPDIPYGETISYGELAKRIGNPAACRAVGAANGQNPISIIIPCHRVIGTSGKLTGFGGGLPAKKWLLEHEQRYLK